MTFNDRQLARATIEIGKVLRMHAEADMTSRGILAIGILVSGILLSTTVLVATAVREGGRARRQPAGAAPRIAESGAA